MSRRERWLWGALLAFVAASRLVGLGDRSFSHDESLHGFYSYQLATHGTYVHDPMMHGPLQFHLCAAVFRLLGATDATARLVAAFAGIGAIWLLVAFRPLLGRRAAFAAAALATLSPSLAFYSRYMRNESMVALACLLWVLGAFRYLASRRRSDLAWMTLGMGIAFAAKEVAFLFGATIGAFFLARALRDAWRGEERLGHGAAADVVLVHAVLVAPFLGALAHLPFGWSTVAFDAPEAPLRTLLTCGTLALAALAAGIFLRLRTRGSGLDLAMLLALAGGFWAALALLFTTFGRNAPRGLVSGFVGSLGYWLAQHGVQRGGQPAYYYLLLIALYEWLPLACALLAVAPAWRRLRRRGAGVVPAIEASLPRRAPESEAHRARRVLLAFLLWWSAAGLVLYSFAGERMPWLTVHIVLPWLLLGGWGIARGVDALASRGQLARVAGAGVLALGGLTTATIGARALYRDYDLATEMLVYAHGTPDLHRVEAAIAAAQAGKETGERVIVAHDSASSWPLLWYLRDVDHRYLTKEVVPADLADADLLLLAPEACRKAWPWTARDFEEVELLQLWWPVELYREASRLATREGWGTSLGYWLTRRQPGAEVGPSWPLRQEMCMLVRRPGPAHGPLPALEVPVFPLELVRDPVTDRPWESGGAAPTAIAADEAGRILVGDRLTRQILRFDRALRALPAEAAAGGIGAAALAAGPSGTLAAADAEAGVVRLFDAAGTELARWGSDDSARPRRPSGVVRWGDGFVVADSARAELCELSLELAPRGICRSLSFAPEALSRGDGRLLAVDRQARRVVAVVDGGERGFVESGDRRIPGWRRLPADARPGIAEVTGWLLLADPSDHRLVVLDENGEPGGYFEPRGRDGAPLWQRPEALALDPVGGRLLIADSELGKLYALPLPALERALASLPGSAR